MSDETSVEDLESLLLGGQPRYTSVEVAAAAGVPLDRARRFWRALGFAGTGNAPAFTDADVEALRRMVALMDDGTLEEDTAVGLARALGHTSARLAEWQVDLVAEQLSGGTGRRDELSLDDTRVAATRLLPDLEFLLVYAWRRRLAEVVGRVADEDDTLVDAAHLTVGFADLVGFTRLARRLGERELAGLVERFEQAAADIVAGAGGRLVKTLGDEVLFVSDTAEAGAEAALALIDTLAGDEAVPELRIGLATGLVVGRMGDVFGTTVNLASRLTSLARPGSVLCDAVTAERLADHPGIETSALWRRPLRGLGLVEPFALRRVSA